MKQFITKTFLILLSFLLIIFLLLIVSSTIVKDRGFSNYTSESNTLFLKKNQQYDILFMGISHARNFSRHKNHLRIEKILDSKIINIGQGGGACGANEQLFYLDYFFKMGNRSSKIIYVLSPPMLFSETLPIASNTFDNEVFDVSFFSNYLVFSSENKQGRIMSYLQSKFHPSWLFKKPFTQDSEDNVLTFLNKKLVDEGQNLAYGGSELNISRFHKASKIIEKTIRIAKEKNSEVILLIPPALFGKWRGHTETITFAKILEKKYPNVTIFDGSETVLKPEFYYDNHHLNTNGVIYFTENYLKKLME
ncbi:MAG: hypothetical protein EOL88_04505 [Bacteroidia bacterium]|nr:hypothetical protein [Bacteroidia bacterium]